jgi:hypothetical protein
MYLASLCRDLASLCLEAHLHGSLATLILATQVLGASGQAAADTSPVDNFIWTVFICLVALIALGIFCFNEEAEEEQDEDIDDNTFGHGREPPPKGKGKEQRLRERQLHLRERELPGDYGTGKGGNKGKGPAGAAPLRWRYLCVYWGFVASYHACPLETVGKPPPKGKGREQRLRERLLHQHEGELPGRNDTEKAESWQKLGRNGQAKTLKSGLRWVEESGDTLGCRTRARMKVLMHRNGFMPVGVIVLGASSGVSCGETSAFAHEFFVKTSCSFVVFGAAEAAAVMSWVTYAMKWPLL